VSKSVSEVRDKLIFFRFFVLTMLKEKLKTSEKIAVVGVFAPIAIILASPVAPSFPFPPLPFLLFELWEIPVYFALYLFGLRIALLVELLVYAVVQTHPYGLLFAPVYNLNAVVFTLLGASLGFKFKKVVMSATLGVSTRVVETTLFNYVFLRLPPPFGFGLTLKGLMTILPLLALFNAIQAGYSLAIAFAVSKAVESRLELT